MSNLIIANPATFRTPSYQRDTDTRRADKIAEAFDLSSFGTVTVSRRKDGHLYIVDGKHRSTAAVKNGLEGVPTLVLDGLTEEQEAAKFLKLNETKTVSAVDKFKAQVIAGEREQIEINSIVKAHGWTVNAAKTDGNIAAVKALETVFRGAGELPSSAGFALLDTTLDTVTQAWQMNSDGTTASMIVALGKVLGRYSRGVDQQTMVKKLRATTPASLLGRANGNAKVRGVSVRESLAEILVNTYNMKLRKNVLPSWEFRK